MNPPALGATAALRPLVVSGGAVVAGLAAVLGFAPLDWFAAPIVSMAWLLWAWDRAAGRRAAARLGFLWGLGFFGGGVSWVYVSLHEFGAMSPWLAGLATFIFCAFLALFPALVGFLHAGCRLKAVPRALVFTPAAWALSEWVRGWLFTGFPWLALGSSQVPDRPLRALAPVLGVYGVSWAVVASSALVRSAAAARARSARAACLVGLAVLWLAAGAAIRIPWTHPAGAPLTISLLQGDMGEDVKWNPDHVASTLSTYARLVDASRSRLIVLPETALPLFYTDLPRGYLAALARHARALHGDILAGIPERVPDGNTQDYYNSVFSLGSSPTQVYRKSHLVPFGEYIPLKSVFGWVIHHLLHIPMSDFSRGPRVQKPLAVAGQRVAVNICYEDAFGREIIRQLPAATMLVNVSNDAWFGDSAAPYQQLQISQMRALETGRYEVQATNTGVTAIVDPRGRVTAALPLFKVGALNGEVRGYAGRTPYVRFGDHAVAGLAAGVLALSLVGGRRRRPAR